MPATRPVVNLLAAVLALWLGAIMTAAAQTTYPDHPIKIVAPFPAGAPVDIVARLIADRLERTWRQPVVVENRSGGGDDIVTAGALGQRLADDKALFAEIVAKAGIVPQ